MNTTAESSNSYHKTFKDPKLYDFLKFPRPQHNFTRIVFRTIKINLWLDNQLLHEYISMCLANILIRLFKLRSHNRQQHGNTKISNLSITTQIRYHKLKVRGIVQTEVGV